MELEDIYNLALPNLYNSEYILKISLLTKSLSPQIKSLPKDSLKNLYNYFEVESVDLLYAKLSRNSQELKYLREKNNPRINNYLLQNNNISLSSKEKLLLENNFDLEDITTPIISFFATNHPYLNQGILDFYHTNLSNLISFDRFLETYLDKISEFDFSEFNTFLINKLYFPPKNIDRAISFLVNNVKTQGLLIERHRFQEIYKFYSGRESLKINYADNYISDFLPSDYLDFEKYSYLPVDYESKKTPLAIYKYFFSYLDQISYPVEDLIEIFSFMTFYNGTFKELLKLQSII